MNQGTAGSNPGQNHNAGAVEPDELDSIDLDEDTGYRSKEKGAEERGEGSGDERSFSGDEGLSEDAT